MCKFEACWHCVDCKIIHDNKITSNIKPEIGKIRPVVIIYPHKRTKLAMIIPFTTQKLSAEITNTIYIPSGIMPGVLANSECWALCDMVNTVSTDRLQTVFAKNYRRLDQPLSNLPDDYFQQIITKIRGIIV